MQLLHLSDLHFNATDTPRHGIVPSRSLGYVLDACKHLPLDAVIVTGDLTDDASEAGMTAVRSALLDFVRPRGISCVFTIGNHDERPPFRAVFGTGHLSPNGDDLGDAAPAPWCAASSDIAGVRVISLDSLVDGKGYWLLPAEQLAWLDDQLTLYAGTTVVLAVHHPAIGADVYLHQALRLQNPDALAGVIAGRGVAVILSGHFHQQMSGTLAGVPVWLTPGVFTRLDHLTGDPGGELAYAGGSASLITLDSQDLRCNVIAAHDPAAATLAYRLTPEQVTASMAKVGNSCASTRSSP